MCKILKVSKSAYYKYKAPQNEKDVLTDLIIEIFSNNQAVYGTRKIKVELKKLGISASRRRISRIMRKNGLISAYTQKKYKAPKSSTNEDKNPNILKREFDNRAENEVIVSDLTYVRVGNNWNYLCVILDLFNREIVGYSAGKYKDANLVHRAFASIEGNLNNFQIFHTDRGSEFKNYIIADLLKEFDIKHSLSRKGSPHDNAVAEAQFKVIKTEFVKRGEFKTLEHLQLELKNYVDWFNNKRIHGSLDYKTPVEFKQQIRLKSV